MQCRPVLPLRGRGVVCECDRRNLGGISTNTCHHCAATGLCQGPCDTRTKIGHGPLRLRRSKQIHADPPSKLSGNEARATASSMTSSDS